MSDRIAPQQRFALSQRNRSTRWLTLDKRKNSIKSRRWILHSGFAPVPTKPRQCPQRPRRIDREGAEVPPEMPVLHLEARLDLICRGRNRAAIARIIKTSHANDPYEEHDLGAFEADGRAIFSAFKAVYEQEACWRYHGNPTR